MFHHIWRDELPERKKILLENQELLKQQMDEFNNKRTIEKFHILKGDDIDKSIFRTVMRNDKINKQAYGEDLIHQMKEIEKRKSAEQQQAR